MAQKFGRFFAVPALLLALAITSAVAAQLPQASTVASATHEANPVDALRVMIARGQATEALKQLDLLATQQPLPAGVQRLRGQALYNLNRLPEAESAFEAAIKQAAASHEQDRESNQLLGLTLYQLGRPADAIPYLEQAHTATTNQRANPSFVLALCYADTHRYDDARHAFAQQYGFAPDSAAAYLLAARMFFRREDALVAEDFARKALTLDASLPLAHQLLGEVALAGEHLDEAIAEFQLERLRDPLEGSVYDRLGDAYLRAGNYQLAQESLQQALLLEPDSTGPYILLGKVLLRRDDPAGALTYLQRADAMDSENYRTHNLLSQAYRALGRRDDAARELQTVRRLQAVTEPKPMASPSEHP